MRRPVRGVLAALLVAFGVIATSGIAAARPERSDTDPAPGSGSVVVLMVPRSTWKNAPPELASWAASSLVLHSITVGRVTLDSYLSIGKGRRTRGPVTQEIGPVVPHGATGARIAAWDDLVRLDATFRYGGHLGALGTALKAGGVDTSLVTSDPAAAGAAADERGVVSRYISYDPTDFNSVPKIRREISDRRGLVLVETPLSMLTELLATRDGHCTVVMSSSSYHRAAQLGIFAMSPECGVGVGQLVGPSTRQPGYVALPDIAPTLLTLVGLHPSASAFDGGMVSVSGTTDYGRLIAANRRSLGGWRAAVPMAWLLVAANAAVAVAFAARWRYRRELAAVAIAMPASTLLIMVFPWARWGGTPVALVLTVLIAAVLAALAIRVCRPNFVATLGALSLFTALLIGIDGSTGGHLELDSPLANNAIGAGRFTGIGNIPYGFYIAGCIIAAVLGIRRWGTRSIAPIGAALALAAFVDGAPFLGADVGGLLAAIPAFTIVIALSVRRISLKWLAAATAIGVVVVGALIALDLSRGEDGSHLARVLRGGRLGSAMARKELAALHSFTDVPMTLAFVLFIVVVAASWRRLPRTQVFVAGFWGMLAAVVLGTFLNDSGVAVASAIGFAVIAFVLVLAEPLPAEDSPPPPT